MRTIYSNSGSSEQFLVTECFLTGSWRFLICNKLEQLEFKLEKNIGVYKHAGKVRKEIISHKSAGRVDLIKKTERFKIA